MGFLFYSIKKQDHILFSFTAMRMAGVSKQPVKIYIHKTQKNQVQVISVAEFFCSLTQRKS